jgi:hypothetical protein
MYKHFASTPFSKSTVPFLKQIYLIDNHLLTPFFHREVDDETSALAKEMNANCSPPEGNRLWRL